MPNQNGRNMNRGDGGGERGWRPQDDDRMHRDRDDRTHRERDDRMMRDRGERDREDERYRDRDRGERGDRERMTERYGGGQSGYGSGRMGDDRSMGAGFRNQSTWNRDYDDRQGMHTDDRFTGRGGEGYWEDRSDRPGYASGYNRGGMGYGGYGGGMQPNVGRHQGFRGGSVGAQMADEYNQGRSYPDAYGPGEYGQQRQPSDFEQGVGYGQGTGGRWANVPQSGIEGYGSGQQQGGYGYGQQGVQGREGGLIGGHRGKGPQGYQRSDDRIKETVCEVLSDDDHIDASHIEVVVKNGEVMLTGTVEDRRQKRLAEDVIERLPGVKDVQNQLRVASERPQRGNQNVGSAVGRTETETSSTEKKGRA